MPPDAAPPGPLPDPPADLATQPLPILALDQPWVRSHQRHLAPLYFGRGPDYRFNAPGGQFGALYVARSYHGAFIETFVRDLADRFVPTAILRARYLTEVRANRPLRLVDLRGPGLRQLGADARLTTGSYQIAQRWALALYQHPDQPDGILYRSRYDPAQECAALFDRVEPYLTAGPSLCLADPQHATLLADILDTYQIEWLDE